jgi:hypothetical protein
MPSDFAGFDVNVVVDGVEYPVAGETVLVFDIEDVDETDGSGAVALPDLATDGAGHVAAGVLAIDAGRRVRFSVTRAADGLCRSYTQVTT